MSNENRGQGSPNSTFFHVTFHKDNKKWHALEVNSAMREEFDSKEEALQQVKDWIEEWEIKGNAHISIHDEHGKIVKTESL